MVALSQRRCGLPVTVEVPTAPPPLAIHKPGESVIDPDIYTLHPDDIRDAAALWRGEPRPTVEQPHLFSEEAA
jgi:hypothetical protein